MIQLEKIGDNEWLFIEPACVNQLMEEFHGALEMREDGLVNEAEAIIRDIIHQCPDFIDAIHHLALIADSRGMTLEYYLLEKEAVERALANAPPTFSLTESQLEYGVLENRPFFRAYHGLGLAYFYDGQFDAAMTVFKNLVSLCPNDNMGARALVVECGFKLSQPNEVLALCDQYQNDGLVELLYGRPLALYQLGKTSEVENYLCEAVADSPLVANALLAKIQLAPDMSSGFTQVGGQDEAFEYYLRSGQFWKNTQGALALLESVVNRSQL